jgi:hypothetical protein
MILMVPKDDGVRYPTLGPQVVDWMQENLVFGPGDLRGQPLVLDGEQQAFIWKLYEVFPKGHHQAGRRRFRRCALSLAKGLRKTEFAAFIAAAELHPTAPVRFNGWSGRGLAPGRGVTDPFVVLVAYTEEQSDELAYGALRAILEESPIARDFDIGLERIMRIGGDGKAVSLAGSPNARDGARTTFQCFDEPLALDTPVITTTGWKTIGTVQPGDYVYDRRGNPTEVLGASPVHVGRSCYRVTFVDGDQVVTDAGHRWAVTEWSNRPAGEAVRTTVEMFERGVDTAYGKRWRLPRPNGFDGVADGLLPIDPYVLGLWIGDGDKSSAYVTSGVKDAAEVMSLVGAAGYATKAARDSRPGPVRFISEGLRPQLRRAGVLGLKHIPQDYLLASRAERLALLQGLMDSDGHSTPLGNCTFVQGKKAIAEDVLLLVRSLGMPATLNTTVDVRSRTGVMHKVQFTPHLPVFRIARKLNRLAPGPRRNTWWPAIDRIEPCESVPVRCIAVASADHLFLVGRGLNLTHNTHWHTSPRLIQAHQTMQANLPKRKLSDAWALEITTAPEPGGGSIAERTMEYAQSIADGKASDASLFFFHRQASDHHDLGTKEGARAAVIEASGEAASWRDIEAIVGLWNDPTTDRQYWERVWCNRLVKAGSQAFDVVKWKTLAQPVSPVKPGDMITLGFDGGQFHDSTVLVGTHVKTGYQWPAGMWECPPGRSNWQVPVGEVDAVVRDLFARFTVWRMYADPPYWQSWIATWQGVFGEERVIEWWTNRYNKMARAIEGFYTAIADGSISHDGSPDVARHLGNSRKQDIGQRDEQGRPMWVIRKDRPDSPQKIDAGVASVLSWEARTDAIAAGAQHVPEYSMMIVGGRK